MNFLIRNILLPLRDIIYPQVCFLCNRSLANGETKVCADCWNSFPPLTPSHPTWVKHQQRFQNEGHISNILSCYLFEQEGKVQEVIHLLKYQGITLLGLRLGRDIGEKIREERLFTKADYLIPVPLHKAKLRERGYNQSELLCKGIAEVTKIPMSSTFLKRKRHTQTQTRLSWEERKQNVSNAFMIETKHEKVLAGTTVIVVDDVITTGSTINECAKILRECGVREVFAASAALA